MNEMKIPSSSRVFGLDLIRATAVLLVLAWHSGPLIPSKTPFFGKIVSQLNFSGFAGVEMFFVLSGFLIGQILIRRFDDFQGRKTVFEFWARRWLRTLPAFYIYLAVHGVLAFFRSNLVPKEMLSAFFLQNFAWRISDFFTLSWSLAIEEWFYLLFPLVAALLFVSGLRGRKAVLVAAVSMGFASICARLWFAHRFPSWNWRFDLRRVVVLRFDSLMVGALLAYVKLSFGETYTFLRKHTALTGLALILMCDSFATEADSTPFGKTFILFLCPLGIALMLPRIESYRSSSERFMVAIRSISLWSYSMYLINNLVVDLVKWASRQVFREQSPFGAVCAISAVFGLCLVFSRWSYLGFERPFLRIRDRWFPS